MAERIEKSWGYEEIIHNGEFCCKKLVYMAPTASSLHYHPKKSEAFVVAQGYFSVFVDLDLRDWVTMSPGDSVVIPAGTKHRVRCLVPGYLVEASTHDDPNDCVRLILSET